MANITREERLRREALKSSTETLDIPMTTPEPDPTIAGTASTPQPPVFSVAERRLKHGDLSMMSEMANIALVGTTEPMALYWGMTEHAYELINIFGWVPVHARYLPMAPNLMGLSQAPDGHVTRGQRGSEMLFMMPSRLREAQLFKAANDRQMKRLSRRHHLQNAIASAEADAHNPALSAARREGAARSAASMAANQKAKFTFTEYTESHSRNSGVE